MGDEDGMVMAAFDTPHEDLPTKGTGEDEV